MLKNRVARVFFLKGDPYRIFMTNVCIILWVIRLKSVIICSITISLNQNPAKKNFLEGQQISISAPTLIEIPEVNIRNFLFNVHDYNSVVTKYVNEINKKRSFKW